MIMVDEFRVWGPTRQVCFRYGSSHMTTDGDIKELHAFAARLSLTELWFHNGSTPHYDLASGKRDEALAKGAVFVPAVEQARRRLADGRL